MRQSLLYSIAAILFAIATALTLSNDGVTLKAAAGLIMFGVMVALALKTRKEGK